jgi:hypothetical protein
MTLGDSLNAAFIPRGFRGVVDELLHGATHTAVMARTFGLGWSLANPPRSQKWTGIQLCRATVQY